MRKLLVAVLLAAFAPLGIAHAASPKPTPTKAAMSMPMKGKMTGKKKPAKKPVVKKMSTKKPAVKKTMPMRDPKTGRFMKKPTPTPAKK
ncbi:hypothetical protein IAD21_04104 [Abditibacteriota bacterium]|nr:hypothetical protein IAD21_04104 [Abditibacteriota bacterium]